MKLNEFKHSKKVKIDEVDTSSVFGNYGSANIRSGIKSLFGKSTLSTQDQIAKDQFVKTFASKAATGLQDAIQSGWVAPGSVSTQPSPNPAANPNVNTAEIPKVDPNANTTPNTTVDPNVKTTTTAKKGAVKSPEQTKKELEQKLAAAQTANKSPEQIRQQKLNAAAKAAQDQMANNGTFSKLPADQFAKSASNVRQQQQGVATQNAQDEMLPVSKLPTDQFGKSASNVRQQQQGQATTSAQGQMTTKIDEPTPKTPEQIRQEKQAAAMQAAQDQMLGNIAPITDKTKPDNTVQMPKKKKINPGKNAFGQMAQNLDKAAESTRFDRLNFLFESIIAEADEAEAEEVPKKSISQWIIDFFKKFMKGEDITSDPTIMANVIALAKELEKNYKTDKGKTTIPKLANLAWSATHSPGERSANKPTPPDDEPTTPNKSLPSNNNPPNNTLNNPPNQKAQTTLAQVKSLLKDLTPKQKQTILTNLQKELAKDDTISFGGKKQDPNDPTTAKMMAMAKQQGKI